MYDRAAAGGCLTLVAFTVQRGHAAGKGRRGAVVGNPHRVRHGFVLLGILLLSVHHRDAAGGPEARAEARGQAQADDAFCARLLDLAGGALPPAISERDAYRMEQGGAVRGNVDCGRGKYALSIVLLDGEVARYTPLAYRKTLSSAGYDTERGTSLRRTDESTVHERP